MTRPAFEQPVYLADGVPITVFSNDGRPHLEVLPGPTFVHDVDGKPVPFTFTPKDTAADDWEVVPA